MTPEEVEAGLVQDETEMAELVQLERRYWGTFNESLVQWVNEERAQLVPWETIARSLGVGVDTVKGRYLYRPTGRSVLGDPPR